METLWRDMRYALRTMWRSPAFTTAAVLSLALGMGANTAIFSVINAVMLRTLKVQHPEQLVEFLIRYPGDPPGNIFSWQSYEHFRDHSHVFSAITGVQLSRFNVRGEHLEPEAVVGGYVVGNFFEMLGVKPAVGRLIGPGDSAEAVVSWSYWKSRLNQDRAIAGRRIVVDDVPVTIIGVAPREFFGLHPGVRTDIWMPVAVESRLPRPAGPLALIARLRPGVSMEQARAEMAVLFRWTLEERTKSSKDPLMRQLKFEVQRAGAGLSTPFRMEFAKPLLALMAVVGLLLLIACTNMASMLLARGAARQREMAIRVSLGAGRFQLARHVLTQSLLLSAAGALLGVFLAYFGADALVRVMTSGRPMIGMPAHIEIQVHPDMRVLLFTGGIALLTALLFGLAPAWSAFTFSPGSSMREIGGASETRLRRRFGKALVVAQVAFSIVLLSAASLFVRHLADLEHLDLGFRRDHVLLASVEPARSGSSGEQLSRTYQELLARLQAIPGVRSATICAPTPLSGAGASRFVNMEGHHERPEDRRYVSVSWVAPRYFETLGTPLLAGRDFSTEDRSRPRVAIVNQAMARYYFAGGNPTGKYFTFDGENTPYEIVGMAGDAKYYEIHESPGRTVYLNTFQFSQPVSNFVIRTKIKPEAVEAAVRTAMRSFLKTAPVVRITTLTEQVDASIVPERLIAMLSGLFGALGALLAAIGIYGLLAYTVERRINEIGIRMALGATRSRVIRMVVVDAFAMVIAGLVIGAPVAYWAKSLATSLIQGLSVKSLAPIAFSVVAMIAIALVAAYVPARRAARVDPMEALRYE